jgi:hypothetical protein
MPFVQYVIPSETLPSVQEWQMGAQTLQQQCPHSRYASPHAYIEAQLSMQQATLQAQVEQHRHVNILFTALMEKYQ